MSGVASADRVRARASMASFALALATACLGCGGGVGQAPRPETLYASWSIEELDVSRGEVRLGGPVEVDPDARDLEIVDGTCARRAIGGGVWTRNRLVWRLSASDIGAALGCTSRIGVRAKRFASSLASVSSFNHVRLDLTLEEDPDQAPVVSNVDHAYDGDESVVRVRTHDPNRLVLSAAGFAVGPSETDDEVATFRLPTARLVSAALRGDTFRFFVGGARTRVAVALYIDNNLVTSKDSTEEATEEESSG